MSFTTASAVVTTAPLLLIDWLVVDVDDPVVTVLAKKFDAAFAATAPALSRCAYA